MHYPRIAHCKADSRVAVIPNHQVVVLSTDQSKTHIEDLSWSNLYSVGQLDFNGRYHLRHSGL